MQPTLLVHEAYLRLVDTENPQDWTGRGHYFAAAAEAMRRILIEYARRKQSLKCGGEWQRVECDASQLVEDAPDGELLALDDALTRLEEQWPEKSRVVNLRYFVGRTISEAARAMDVSVATAERHWKSART